MTRKTAAAAVGRRAQKCGNLQSPTVQHTHARTPRLTDRLLRSEFHKKNDDSVRFDSIRFKENDSLLGTIIFTKQ
jgi:hypothetical protein